MSRIEENQLSKGDEAEIPTTDIDVDAIMASIRRNIQRRRNESLGQAAQYPDLEEITCPQEPDDDEHNPMLYFHLRQINQPYVWLQLELDIRPSSLDVLPLVGGWWNTVRRHLHSLSIFYVNKIAQPMISFNRHVATTLNIITHQNQKRDAELAKIKQRLAELEAQLARLEEKV